MKANIYDYLLWRGDLTMTQSCFNEIDGAIFSRLAYLPFERICKSDFDKSIKLIDLIKIFLDESSITDLDLSNEDVDLMKSLIICERFNNIDIMQFANQIDKDTETQFFGITFRLDDGNYCIAYRGTDDTLIGLKESFNMSFLCPVGSQKLSVEYLYNNMTRYGGNYYLVGHSKGGNLAVYSASKCEYKFKDNIISIYNYDGPGFENDFLDTYGYKSICSKIKTFLPKSSIIGMFLERKEQCNIILSTQKGGIWQHDLYSWEVMKNKFVCVDDVDNTSKYIDNTIKLWICELDHNQRQQFVDTVYTIVSQTDATTYKDLGSNRFNNSISILMSIKNLDESTRKAVFNAIKLLAINAKEGAFLTFQNKE